MVALNNELNQLKEDERGLQQDKISLQNQITQIEVLLATSCFTYPIACQYIEIYFPQRKSLEREEKLQEEISVLSESLHLAERRASSQTTKQNRFQHFSTVTVHDSRGIIS